MRPSLPGSETLIERAKPLLGTIAAVRAAWSGEADAAAVDRAFAAVAEVQARMSAFDPESDLGRLHAVRCGRFVPMAPPSLHVIRFARDLAAASDGRFDPALGGEAAARGAWPVPVNAAHALDEVQGATWRDIEVEAEGVVLRRPLWLDLNGVAKGFAVDRAIACLQAAGAVQASVNIGGDLAVFGPGSETVRLRTTASDAAPEIVLRDGALASSGGAVDWVATRHFDGASRAVVDPRRFACVLAPDAMTADALTKAVLGGRVEAALLRRYAATALTWAPDDGWQTHGETGG
jgi:thiamine biosynthesis lipoprotein